MKYPKPLNKPCIYLVQVIQKILITFISIFICELISFSIISAQTSASSNVNSCARVTDRNEWYYNSTMGFLIEYPVSHEDQLTELIKRGRLDFITTACDFFGPVVYPSTVPAAEQMKNLKMDHLKLYSEVARKNGIKFVAGFYGLNSYPAAEKRPEWRVIRADGTPFLRDGHYRNMCVNSSFPEELMLPRLKEVYNNYHPDGFWFDCDNWYYPPCYCVNCSRLFREEFGIDPPKDQQSPDWQKFMEFHRKSFVRYINKVGDFIHSLNPKLAYVTNWGYTFMQPDPAPAFIDFISSDIGFGRRTEMVSFYAHHLDAEPLPWDAMLSTWIGIPDSPYNFSPPKSIEYICQEYAVAASHGGNRAHLWGTFNRDDYLHPSDIQLAERLSAFLHERDAVFKNTAPVRHTAVLHSASTYYIEGGGLYGHRPALHRVAGANIALRQNHIHFQILNEDYLLKNLDDYKVIVLPEQTHLTEQVITALRRWTEKGGSLIVTGLSATQKQDNGKYRMLLSDVLGVEFADADTINPGFIRMENPIFHAPLRTAFYPVKVNTANVIIPLEKDKNVRIREVLPYPAVTINTFGKGKAIYIAADLFSYYFRFQYPGILNLISGIVKLADPLPQIETDAPKAVTFSLRTKGKNLITHLVNEGTDWDMGHFEGYTGNFYVENVPPVGPISLKVRCVSKPTNVYGVPDIGTVDWHWDTDGVWIKVPGVHIHQGVVLENAFEK